MKSVPFYGETLLFATVSVVFVAEGDMRIGDLIDPAVRDRRTKGITAR